MHWDLALDTGQGVHCVQPKTTIRAIRCVGQGSSSRCAARFTVVVTHFAVLADRPEQVVQEVKRRISVRRTLCVLGYD